MDAFNFLTNTKPARPVSPPESNWKTKRINAVQSDHPYVDNFYKIYEIKVPEAKYIRVKVKKYDLETNYDKLFITDAKNGLADTITGAGENYVSEYVEGDTVKVTLKTDRSETRWGFYINEIEYQ